MADQNQTPKVEKTPSQADADKIFAQKAEKFHMTKGRKMQALKGRNKIVGLLLAGGVLSIYGYTMFSVRQGKMMEAFDKVPE